MVTQKHAPQSRLEQRLAWARQTLELADDASPATTKSRMLRLLTDEDFVPAEACLQALRTLQAEAAGVAELNEPPAFARDRERQVEAEVETFAAGMFRLPPAKRQTLWQRLYAQTEEAVRARVRLEQLQAGLAVDLAVLNTASAAQQQLARHLSEVFARKPLERVTRREEILAQADENGQQLVAAARELLGSHADIVALDRELIRRLQAPADSSVPLELMKFKDESRERRRESGDRVFQLLWILPLLLLGGLIALAFSASEDRERIHRRTSDPDPFKRPSPEDMRRIQEMLRQLQERRNNPQPAGP